MPINVYTGLMRSGKSYEVVSEVILPAIASGRRVVTNVDGIDNDRIREYVAEKNNLPIDTLGHVIHCTNEDVFKPDFFPYYDDAKSAVTDTFCQPGDLVCIDEAWRFWGTDKKIHPHHRSFFLEHGHFVHPSTRVACDLVMMIQDMGTLHRSIKAVVAFSFRTHKKVSLGMGNTYSVNMWEGSKMTRGGLIGTWVRTYKKQIFPLYSSFKGGVEGKTVNTDKRQNVLANPRLIFMAIGFVLLAGFSFYYVWHFFHPTPAAEPAKNAPAGSSQGGASKASGTPAKPPGKTFSDTWRIVGRFMADGQAWIVLASASGRLRVDSPSNYTNQGFAMVGDVDGERITVWSGPMPTQIQGNMK